MCVLPSVLRLLLSLTLCSLLLFLCSSSLLCFHLRPNGRMISVPSQNILTPPLSLGDIVTFSYERHAKKTDMVLNPTVVRIRTDLSWQDVVTNAAREARYLSGMWVGRERWREECIGEFADVIMTEHSKMGEISLGSKGELNAKTLRSHMERMVRRRGLDPLLPETWLQVIPKFKVKPTIETSNNKTLPFSFCLSSFSNLSARGDCEAAQDLAATISQNKFCCCFACSRYTYYFSSCSFSVLTSSPLFSPLFYYNSFF